MQAAFSTTKHTFGNNYNYCGVRMFRPFEKMEMQTNGEIQMTMDEEFGF